MSPRRLSGKDVALIAAFAALIAALGGPFKIVLPFSPVPITLQTLGVMLAGLLLGWRRGAAAVLTFLSLVLIGFPLLAGGRGGLAVFAGPSAGYLIGWVFGAAVTGLMARGAVRSLADRTTRATAFPQLLVAAIVGGLGVVYAFGIPVLAARTAMSLPEAALSSLTFVPGDLLKAVLAALVASAVVRAYPPVVETARRVQPANSTV